MSLRVLQPGLQTTVQDLGRYGRQQEGIPVSGAMDLFALRLANIVVGNDETAAALEMTLVGAGIVFTEDHVIALSGADFGAAVNGRPLQPWRAARVVKGATLSFATRSGGCRAYLAVAGGIDVPPVLDSRSTYLRASFGGLDGRPLRTGDVLPVGAHGPRSERIAAALERVQDEIAVARWTPGLSMRPRYNSAPTLRVVKGTHTDALSSESLTDLFGADFRISTHSDRMGYRLDGPKLRLREPLRTEWGIASTGRSCASASRWSYSPRRLFSERSSCHPAAILSSSWRIDKPPAAILASAKWRVSICQ